MFLSSIYNKFKIALKNRENVMGMNRRNLEYIYPNNPRKYFQYANNKLLTKKTLESAGVSVPKTFMEVSYFFELQKIEKEMKLHHSFVIKPSSGSGGNGILVIDKYRDGIWFSVSGKKYTLEMIKKHIADIIFGVYSFGLNDTAIVEERIIQEESISKLSPLGLADIRMINYKNKNIAAMLRIATCASDGKANLHQGGIGVSIDIDKGVTCFAQIKREDITHHPDTNEPLLNVNIPYWNQLKQLCEQTSRLIPMNYLGIDIALGVNGPIILEVNARPGIEIQNVSHSGLIERLS